MRARRSASSAAAASIKERFSVVIKDLSVKISNALILPHKEPDGCGYDTGEDQRAEHAPETAQSGERVDVVGVFRVQVVTIHLAPRGDRAG